MTFLFRMHFRFLWLWFAWWLAGKPRGLVSRLQFKATAFECDWMGHISNSRYFEFFDLGRTHLFLLTLVPTANGKPWTPIAVGHTIRYIKEIKWRTRFELETVAVRFEGKAVVMRSRMYVGEKLMAECETKLLVVQDKKVIDPGFLKPMLAA